jgi:hypothetical protein
LPLVHPLEVRYFLKAAGDLLVHPRQHQEPQATYPYKPPEQGRSKGRDGKNGEHQENQSTRDAQPPITPHQFRSFIGVARDAFPIPGFDVIGRTGEIRDGLVKILGHADPTERGRQENFDDWKILEAGNF